jgi:hypothetical protein
MRTNGSSVATPIYMQYGGVNNLLYNGVASGEHWIKTDGSRIIEYLTYSGSGSASIYVMGYREIL